jgi:two-component system chemotaxis response regulator CheB
MPKRDIVVIGASAGGVTAMKRLFASLPGDFDAAVFAVIHIGTQSTGALAEILSRAGQLPAAWAVDDEPFRRGRIHIARADHHLLLRNGRTFLRRGPHENMTRPAIDPLFRSAAVEYGTRCIGVILSGALGDGAAGLRAIKRVGGLALVQNPAEAECPEMPERAVEWAKPDHVEPILKLGALLAQYVRQEAPPAGEPPDDLVFENDVAFGQDGGMKMVRGERSVYSCPECQGALWEIEDGDLVSYRCHVGHAFSADSMMQANERQLEGALWSALRIIEERAELVRRLASSSTDKSRNRIAARYQERAAEYEEHAAMIRELLRQSPRAEARARRRAARARS